MLVFWQHSGEMGKSQVTQGREVKKLPAPTQAQTSYPPGGIALPRHADTDWSGRMFVWPGKTICLLATHLPAPSQAACVYQTHRQLPTAGLRDSLSFLPVWCCVTASQLTQRLSHLMLSRWVTINLLPSPNFQVTPPARLIWFPLCWRTKHTFHIMRRHWTDKTHKGASISPSLHCLL